MATPVSNITNALSAYNRAATSATGGGVEPRDGTKQDEFADLVRSALKEARKIGERGEQMSIQGIQDRADLNQVITAVAEAEVTLQTVVSIRDKVIEAYREVLRMPI